MSEVKEKYFYDGKSIFHTQIRNISVDDLYSAMSEANSKGSEQNEPNDFLEKHKLDVKAFTNIHKLFNQFVDLKVVRDEVERLQSSGRVYDRSMNIYDYCFAKILLKSILFKIAVSNFSDARGFNIMIDYSLYGHMDSKGSTKPLRLMSIVNKSTRTGKKVYNYEDSKSSSGPVILENIVNQIIRTSNTNEGVTSLSFLKTFYYRMINNNGLVNKSYLDLTPKELTYVLNSNYTNVTMSMQRKVKDPSINSLSETKEKEPATAFLFVECDSKLRVFHIKTFVGQLLNATWITNNATAMFPVISSYSKEITKYSELKTDNKENSKTSILEDLFADDDSNSYTSFELLTVDTPDKLKQCIDTVKAKTLPKIVKSYLFLLKSYNKLGLKELNNRDTGAGIDKFTNALFDKDRDFIPVYIDQANIIVPFTLEQLLNAQYGLLRYGVPVLTDNISDKGFCEIGNVTSKEQTSRDNISLINDKNYEPIIQNEYFNRYLHFATDKAVQEYVTGYVNQFMRVVGQDNEKTSRPVYTNFGVFMFYVPTKVLCKFLDIPYIKYPVGVFNKLILQYIYPDIISKNKVSTLIDPKYISIKNKVNAINRLSNPVVKQLSESEKVELFASILSIIKYGYPQTSSELENQDMDSIYIKGMYELEPNESTILDKYLKDVDRALKILNRRGEITKSKLDVYRELAMEMFPVLYTEPSDRLDTEIENDYNKNTKNGNNFYGSLNSRIVKEVVRTGNSVYQYWID